MAAKPFLLIISLLSIFFFFSTTTFVVSRSLSEEAPETTTLDVSSSIQKSIGVLNFNPEHILTQFDQNEQQFVQSSSSSFSIPLLSRSTVQPSIYKNYTDLTISRLEHDSGRVKSLSIKLDLKLNDVKRSELTPLETEISPQDLQAPITSGSSQGSGEYFSRVGVGSPAKPMYLVIDTGSDISWLQCKPCTDCYQQTDPIFDPSASSSYSPLTCEANACQSLEVSLCRSSRCLYQVSYGDGSYTVGEFATETLSFGHSGSVSGVAIGCGHDNEGLFAGSAGLLGLGGGALSLPSQIKATSFSYCLVDRDSSASSTLEFNSPRPADSITAPFTRNKKIDTFFYIGLTGLGVGGKMLSIPQSLFQVDDTGHGGIIVDSGTAVTRLRTEAYNSLRDSFKMYTQDLPAAASFALFDTCYDLSGKTSVTVPTVSFHFAGEKKLTLPPNNYLIPVDSAGTHCFAFAPTSSSLSIIGNLQQQGTRVSYDLTNSVVGFSQGKC